MYRLTDLAGGLWAPDGGAVAFSDCCAAAAAGFIDILEVATGASHRVQAGDVRDLAWSPDGRRLAYVPMDQYQAGTGLRTVDRDGTNVRSIVLHQGAGEPRWLDNTRIAYTVGTPNVDEPAFFVARVDRPGQSQELRAKDPPDDLDPRIVYGYGSSDGAWVVYFDGPYRRGEGKSLAWNRATRELTPLQPRLTLAEWAPGTHRALILSIDPVTSFGLAEAFDFDTGVRTKLAGGFESRWAADGKTVLYLGYQCPTGGPVGPTELFSAPAAGGAPRNLSAAPDELEYEFAPSPAGSAFVYAAVLQTSPPSWRLHVRDLAGGVRIDLAFALEPDVGDRSWSPDGRYLLFGLGHGHGVCE